MRAVRGVWWLGRRLASGGPRDFDLVVIGGGSGGLACAKEDIGASSLGARVAVCDFVEPSPAGSTWGLGGTCVNVGCIPKKLMHQAGLLGKSVDDAPSYGWDLHASGPKSHDWSKLREAVQNHIKSLNWGHRVLLKDKKVTYFNGFGSFLDPNRIRVVLKNGKEEILSTKSTVIAVGLRPRIPPIPGADLGISSDDVFSLAGSPGRTCVVGGSYVALECAGFLTGLGLPSTVLMRSIPLRGFDQEMAELVLAHMEEEGTRVLRPAVPSKVSRNSEGSLAVEWTSDGNTTSETFDTLLWAIGREPRLGSMSLEKAGVELDPGSGCITIDPEERTSQSNVYALGDVAHGVPELTPSAIMAGKLLGRRLFGGSSLRMDYAAVPTTVFTPLEYGAVGLSEEDARAAKGDDGIEVLHAFFKPLEYNLPGRSSEQCYLKVIAERGGSERVLGLHFTGPHAGEVTQGFAAAIKAGLTLPILQTTVGIHPTSAEEIVKAHITKRSGIHPKVTGC